MDLPTLFQKLAIALGLGLLVGLQRQHAASPLAGIRTFALITLLGALAGLLGREYGGWVIAAGFVALAAALAVGNLIKFRTGTPHPGMTTEVAVLVMYALGAYLIEGPTAVAVAIGGVVAVLLHFKTPLHEFASRVGEKDLRAVMQLVLIALVILPVLPDRGFGPEPFDVLNPRRIWWIVVLISSISLGGYVAYKVWGAQAGALLAGLLGGVISSTATTASYARRASAAEGAAAAPMAALVIVIASAVSSARVLVWVTIFAPAALRAMAPPLATFLGVKVLVSAAMYALHRRAESALPEQKDPVELKAALTFGVLYALILLAVAVAKHYFGSRGLYVVGVISGLTDMDAITLSTSQMVRQETVAAVTAWRVILLAALSNLVFKGAMVAALGSRALLWRVGLAFGATVVGGVAILLLWPA